MTATDRACVFPEARAALDARAPGLIPDVYITGSSATDVPARATSTSTVPSISRDARDYVAMMIRDAMRMGDRR